ncbi:MAG: ArsC/Spx/MgsR family protein [Acidimicrobiales bacterium]
MDDIKIYHNPLVKHPELMQRPIIVRSDRAVLARPSERVLTLLEG